MKHMFDIIVATKIGIQSAVILENLYFWIEKNKANKKHFIKGTYWTYNSSKAFAKQFPYLSEKQIETSLNKLKKEGYILVEKLDKNKLNRTNWYSITQKGFDLFNNSKQVENVEEFFQGEEEIEDENYNVLYSKNSKEIKVDCISPNGEMDFTFWGNGLPKTGKSKQIVNNTNINNTYNSSSSEKKLKTISFKEEEKTENVNLKKENKKIESAVSTLSTKDYQYILKDFFAYMQKDFEINSKIQKDILNILSKGYSIEEIKSTIDFLIIDLQEKGEPQKITTNYILNPIYFELSFQKYQSTKKYNSSKPKPSYDLEQYNNYSIFDEIEKNNNSNFIKEIYDVQLDRMHQNPNKLDISDNNEFYDDTENYDLNLAY